MGNGKKPNTITVRVPADLKRRIENYSAMQGVSINQFALYALTKEIGELEANRYFSTLLREKNKREILAAFDQVMSQVPDREVPEWDKLK
jgi:uncharacterized protein (DUF1778 family)